MARMTDEDQQRLNECAYLWKTTPEEGNEAARKRWFDEIWIILFRSYDNSFAAYEIAQNYNAGPITQTQNESRELQNNFLFSTDFVELIVKLLGKYDPEEAEFSHYFNEVFKKRKVDTNSNDVLRNPGFTTVNSDIDPESECEETAALHNRIEAAMEKTTLYQEGGRDDSVAAARLLLQLYSFQQRRTEGRNHRSAVCCDLMLTDFLEGLLRYLDNVQRDAFESEKPTGAMLAEGKLFPTADAFEDNDQEFFAVLEKDFLDWFMEVQDAPHRTVRALRTHERKFKGELFEGESMTDRVTVTPKDWHMPAKYYQEYIRKIGGIDGKVPSDGQFSKYNDDFHNFLAVAAQAMRRADE